MTHTGGTVAILFLPLTADSVTAWTVHCWFFFGNLLRMFCTKRYLQWSILDNNFKRKSLPFISVLCADFCYTSRHVAPLRDGFSVTSQHQQQQQSIGGSV